MRIKKDIEDKIEVAWKILRDAGFDISIPMFFIDQKLIMGAGHLVPQGILASVVVTWQMKLPDSCLELD